uniref:Uncharacterized protein n=2 Tax=unclassified Prevotella TaxID=2638335 RepID=A0AB33J019_9BACT
MSSLGGDRTEKYVDEMSGFRPEYILEAIVFMSVFFSGYNKISSKHKELVFLNMGLVFCALLLLFMRFGEGGRFGWYFLMGIIYLLTKFSNAKGVYGRIMSIFTIALSCMLFMRVSYSWSFNLVPYKTFLTDGYPSGARWIYEQYEYNHLYTTDKFCRPAFYFINSN